MSRPDLVAIHQPNFLPWLGYFEKILRCDVFVVLDDAQYPKKGGTWINRVRWLLNGTASWVTVPVVRSFRGVRRIDEVEIDDRQPWRRKLLGTLRASYGRHPHFAEAGPMIEEIVSRPAAGIADFNLKAITTLLDAMSIGRSKLVLASDLHASGTATDRLVSIVGAVGGDAYLCGGGALGYQEDEKFARAGLQLRYQSFRHPVYKQPGVDGFVPGLSIVDALMACGVAGTRQLLLTSAAEAADVEARP